MNIPPRPNGACSGSAFLEEVAAVDENVRERRIVEEITRGNLPDFLRRPMPVRITRGGRQPHEAIVGVLPDYLALGSDDDFVITPMKAASAQQVADAFGASLPTQRNRSAVGASRAVDFGRIVRAARCG